MIGTEINDLDPLFDADIQRRLCWRAQQQLHNRCDVSLLSRHIELLNRLQLRRSRSHSTNIPNETQMELALLWRTLGILRYSMGAPAAIQLFYQDILSSLKLLPMLSLSSYNLSVITNESSNNGTTSINFAGISPIHMNKSPKIEGESNNTNHLDSSLETDQDNDPLGLVQKLFDSAENLAMTLLPSERNCVLSFCLLLAVKSGRLSLLIRTALMLSSYDDAVESTGLASSDFIDISLFDDIINFNESQSIDKTPNTGKMTIVGDGVDDTVIDHERNENLLHLQSIYDKVLEDCHIFSRWGMRYKSSNLQNILNITSEYDERSVEKHMLPMNHLVFSFGKGDYGKLGFGDSQVYFLLNSCRICVI